MVSIKSELRRELKSRGALRIPPFGSEKQKDNPAGTGDVHLQKSLLKQSGQYGISLSLDSKGDWFYSRPAGETLSTQTRYAFPITTSVNFPVLRNFSLSPTYTAFFYENQVAGRTITVNTFSITAKWFYDRDSRVPLLKQLLFKGPASQDQTKRAKMK